MTPFGDAVRLLRQKKGVSQKQMAAAIGVSPAYLSALEHGKRGAPSFEFLQRVAGYFNVIWDDADELFGIAALSDPKVVLNTSGLPAAHTAFANRLARAVSAPYPVKPSVSWKMFWKKPAFLIRNTDDPLISAAFRLHGIWNYGQNPYIRGAPSRGDSHGIPIPKTWHRNLERLIAE